MCGASAELNAFFNFKFKEQTICNHKTLAKPNVNFGACATRTFSPRSDEGTCRFCPYLIRRRSPRLQTLRNGWANVRPAAVLERNPMAAAIGGTIPGSIVPILIERHGQLGFATYVSFHRIYLGSGDSPEFIAAMLSPGLLSRAH